VAQSEFEKLLDIMGTLRGPKGCPWDKEQTHRSLRPFLLEEAYEVLETLDSGNPEDLQNELGDLLLQIVFHAQMAKEENRFTIDDVLRTLNEKLIRRHPHVFADATLHSATEQTVHWEKLKKNEGKASVLDGVPNTLPALLRAHRLQQKAATVGFDWQRTDQVWEKVREEFRELEEACGQGHPGRIEEELGDLLFALVNLGRFLNVNPEDALRGSIEKFVRRFQQIERELEARGRTPEQSTLDEMDAIWNTLRDHRGNA